MAIDRSKDSAADIEWARGDSSTREITIGVDITGAAFLLTVNTVLNPTVSPAFGTQLFQVVGAIFDAPGGIVHFTPLVTDTDVAPGRYFYDVQMTDSGGAISTIIKGTCRILQDITK
jgi:hypothetical protein